MNSTGRQDNGPGWRICIVGTGGQGVLTAARLLCDVLVARGHQVVSGQLHGMAQRGGSVQSSVLVDSGISPVIARGRADLVLGFEPVETTRALPLMSARTVVYMNTCPVVPYVVGQQAALKGGDAEYPELKLLTESIRAVTSNLGVFDATRLAVESGSAKTLNMVMLGCLLGAGSLPCSVDDFWDAAAGTMPSKIADMNQQAFFRGVELGKDFRREPRKP